MQAPKNYAIFQQYSSLNANATVIIIILSSLELFIKSKIRIIAMNRSGNMNCIGNVKTFLTGIQEKLTQQDFELVEKAVKVLQHNVSNSTDAPWGDKRCLLPNAEKFQGIWNWDTAFHCVGLSRIDINFAMEHMETFCQFQLENGMFPDVVYANGKIVDTFSKPPVMAWACEIVYKRSGDKEFLSRMYEKLIKNVLFWENKRCFEGLFHYDAELDKGKERKDWIGYETGWDNSVRWDFGIRKLWAIDLNCYMVMTYRSLEFIANELGDDNSDWNRKAKQLSDKINNKLWNESVNCYTDRNYETGEFSNVLSPASFMPLYIHIAPQDAAIKCETVAHDKFGFGMPTVSYDNPNYGTNYWRGPTWLNVAYFAAKGLKDYHFDSTADKIKNTILGWIEKDGDKIHENYNSETGEGLCAEYFSWSAVFVMEFILNF